MTSTGCVRSDICWLRVEVLLGDNLDVHGLICIFVFCGSYFWIGFFLVYGW